MKIVDWEDAFFFDEQIPPMLVEAFKKDEYHRYYLSCHHTDGPAYASEKYDEWSYGMIVKYLEDVDNKEFRVFMLEKWRMCNEHCNEMDVES